MTLNDKLWDFLDAIKLGAFFDDHGIPPIVFPIVVIALVGAVAFFLLSSSGPVEPTVECGDGICSASESSDTCLMDCPRDKPPEPEEKDIRVFLSGGLDCTSRTVILKSADGKTLDTQGGVTRVAITFNSVTERRVFVEVSSPDSSRSPVSSSIIDTTAHDTISVKLDDDYCPERIQTGGIAVSLIDSTNGDSVSGSVTLYDSGGTKRDKKYINGQDTFSNLESGKYYYFGVTATGYTDYGGADDMVFVSPGETARKSIGLDQIPTNPGGQEPTGKLEVCVRSEEGPIESSGEVGIYDVEGNLVKTGSCSDCPLFRGMATGAGCMIFDLPAGRQFYAQMRRAPSSCSDSEATELILIEEGEKEIVRIELECNLVGKIRAIVYGNDSEVLTDECTVELYYENGTKIKTLDLGPDGNYTEEATIPLGTEVYIHAKNVPTGYLETRSRDTELEDGNETMTVEIELDVPPPPPPPLSMVGPRVSKQTVYIDENFTASLSAVKLRGQTVTPADGVSVVCEASWGDTVTAEYNTSWSYPWRCNMTAPHEVGEKTLIIKAQKTGALTASSSPFDIHVINESQGSLIITADELAFTTQTSPVTLFFRLDQRDDPTASLTPVEQIYESSLEVYFIDAGAQRRFVLNSSITRVSDGYFKSIFAIPFRGDYFYDLNVAAIVDSSVYRGNSQGYFIAQSGTAGSLSCDIQPQVASPGELINISASFMLGGEPLADQRLQATVFSSGEPASYPLNWDASTGTYWMQIPAPDSECAARINCTVRDDDSIFDDTNSLYVVDHTGADVAAEDCPISLEQCGCPLGGGDYLQEARACYKIYMQLQSDQYYDHALSCARCALPSCGTAADPIAYGDCLIPMKFSIGGDNGTNQNTIGPFYKIIDSQSETESEVTITYPRSTLGLGGGVEYIFSNIEIPGSSATDTDSILDVNLLVRLDTASGQITAWPQCRLNCGEPGDLDNDGDPFTDYDAAIFNALLDSLEIAGSPPYADWPPECADLDGDGRLTDNDRKCMLDFGSCSSTCQELFEDRGFYSDREICHDGVDNNCDGQTDSDTFDESAGSYYRNTEYYLYDLCDCIEETPCDMLWSISGVAAEIASEAQVARCVSLSYYPDTGFAWFGSNDWQCTSARETEVLECADKDYVCREIGSGYTWTLLGGALSSTYPQNPLAFAASSMTHMECDHESRSCRPVAGSGEDECTGDYWGTCAHGVCDDSLTRPMCDIILGPGRSMCRTDGNCI